MANNNRRARRCNSVRVAMMAEMASISAEEMLDAMAREFCAEELSLREKADREANAAITKMAREGGL